MKIEHITWDYTGKKIMHVSSSKIIEIPCKNLKKFEEKNREFFGYVENYIDQTGFEILNVACNDKGHIRGFLLKKQ